MGESLGGPLFLLLLNRMILLKTSESVAKIDDVVTNYCFICNVLQLFEITRPDFASSERDE